MVLGLFIFGLGDVQRGLSQGIRAYRDQHSLSWTIISAAEDDLWRLDEYRERHPTDQLVVAGLKPRSGMASVQTRHPEAVVISTKGRPGPRDWVVRIDDVSVGRQAIDHLYRCGYRQLACWGSWQAGARQARFQAAEARCLETGCELRRLILPADYPDRETTLTRTVELLAAQPKPLGIFTHQDRPAAWLRGFCQTHGIDIPGEVGIVGVDDDLDLCCNSQPELSSVRMPWQHLGRTMAEQVHRFESSGAVPTEALTIPAYGVHERASTDLRRQQVSDPLVRRFLRLAATAALCGKGVGDLLPKLGCSQPTLYRHLMAAIGRSPSDYIRDLRVAKACDLLQSTELDLRAIAKQSGFSSTKYLHAAFSARYPVTPGVWRKG